MKFMNLTTGLLAGAALTGALVSMGAYAQHIRIQSGTYGGNCGAAAGNATRDLASHCDEHATCHYIVHANYAAAQRASCARDFVAQWSCDRGESHLATLSGEAGNGSTLVLTCVPSTGAGK